jgi:hypothetical protein
MQNITIKEALQLRFHSESVGYELSIEEYLKKILKNVWSQGQPVITEDSSLQKIFSSTKQLVNEVSNSISHTKVFNIDDWRSELVKALVQHDLLPEQCYDEQRNINASDPYVSSVVNTLITFM